MKGSPSGNHLNLDAKDLLLEDYRYLSDSLWKNEQTGETRVNWFIGIVTAVLGGVIGLASSVAPSQANFLHYVVIGALLALLGFGFITLMRVLNRNETTDRFKHARLEIRQLFKDHYDPEGILLGNYPFEQRPIRGYSVDADQAGEGDESRFEGKVRVRKLGGLAHTVVIINSLIIAGVAGAIAQFLVIPEAGWATLAAATGALVVSLLIQLNYVHRRDIRAKRKLKEGQVTRAGGIAYRLENGVAKYLLVGPSQGSESEWLFPKGRIEDGEDHGEAALREVREETGVIARLICPLGVIEFNLGEDQIKAKFYLMEAELEVAPSEKRRLAWLGYSQAMDRLTHETSKYLLKIAEMSRSALQE